MNIHNQEYKDLTTLEQLRKDYEQGIMSAFIGAGFSLNVSDQYLTWTGLLYDMVFRKHEDEIEKAYEEYKSSSQEEKKNKEEYFFDYVSKIINETGALSIASQYVSEHDKMHEAIDEYIEEHIPFAKRDNDKIYLHRKGGETVSCDLSRLKLHRLLLQCLGFRNYFTTNYDNLLEMSIDEGERPITLIRQGKELSNTSADCKIIKIHGSLRDSNDDSMGFDGCHNVNYIITQEDYDSYGEKHSAFKTVLNTEMLQGVFCLIGFSGTDPNFRNCIEWLLKILGGQDENQIKFYLVDISEKKEESYWDRFYKNNHIKIVRLRDPKILEQLELSNYNEIGYEEYTPKDSAYYSNEILLEAFFNYLKKSYATISGNKSASTNSVKLTQAKCAVYDYRKLWQGCLSVIKQKEKLSQLIPQIAATTKTIRFCKIIFPQENFVDLLMNKEPLTEDKAFLFALAVKEIGQIPSYYVNYRKDEEVLCKQPIWGRLIEREKTLHGSLDTLSEKEEDWAIYEHIQRHLFNLDFVKSKKIVCEWNANEFWTQNKAMRLAVYEDQLKEAQIILDNAIRNEKNPSEKLYEVIIANFISRNWPEPYSTDEFWRYGLDGQGDVLNFIMSSLRRKREKPKRRGWIGSTWNIGNNNSDYVKSLRILQYIIDSGIYVSLPGYNMFDIADWYIVFQNLFEYFPYPCFFYSIQYNDKVVQRRIGEDFAYSIKLLNFNSDILIKSLDAIRNEDTPTAFMNGILNVTAAIYIVVDEALWFEKFKNSIFKVFLQQLQNVKDSDELTFNVKFALGSIKKTDNIYWSFQQLISRYSINEEVVSNIIVNNLLIQYIHDEAQISDIILFPNVLNKNTLDLLNTLNNESLLSGKFIDSICEIIQKTDIQDIPRDRVALFQLFNLIKDDKLSVEKIKQIFLSMNIWHCGILNDKEYGWTEPMYIRLNLLNDKITWTDDEFEVIKENLIQNVSSYDEAHKSLHQDPFLKSVQVRYLSDMIKFIDGLKGDRQVSLLPSKKIIEKLLLDRTQYADNIDLMMSEQPADVDRALRNVYEGIFHNGIDKYKEDVDFLIDRAIMKNPIALTRNLKFIKLICEQIISVGYAKKLYKLLSVYKDPESWESLDLRFAFNYLHTIAKVLKQNGESDQVVDFWIENTFVNRFVTI